MYFIINWPKMLHLEVAMVNEFEGIKDELDEVECSNHIPLLMSNVEKWRMWLWTKVFQPLLRGPHKSSLV